MSVYGIETGVIDIKTNQNPNTSYGKSKPERENLIKKLETTDFKVSIIESPTVYESNCKGNYLSLVKLVLKTPVFPNINNKRSMVFIDIL